MRNFVEIHLTHGKVRTIDSLAIFASNMNELDPKLQHPKVHLITILSLNDQNPSIRIFNEGCISLQYEKASVIYIKCDPW